MLVLFMHYLVLKLSHVLIKLKKKSEKSHRNRIAKSHRNRKKKIAIAKKSHRKI